MKKVEVRYSEFFDALEAYSRDSKKSWETLFLNQMKQLGKQVVKVTPPMQANRLGVDGFKDGKKRGEDAVRADISKLFTPLKKSQVKYTSRVVLDTESQLAEFHQLQRNSRGRVGGKRNRGIKALKSVLDAYIKKKKSAVGYLSSGWNALISEGKITGIPSWITDKRGSGAALVKADQKTLKFSASNKVRFASNLGRIERYMQIAVDQQTRNLWKQFADYQAKLQAKLSQNTKAKN